MIRAVDILESIQSLRFSEAITSKDIDALETQFRGVVKSLDKVSDGKGLFEASRLFDLWLRNIIHFIDDRLLGVNASYIPGGLVFTKENPTYHLASQLFDELSNLYVPPFIPGDLVSKFLPDRILQTVAEPFEYSSDWDYAYYAWRLGKNKHRRDLLDFGAASFGTMREVLEKIGGSSYDYYSKKEMKIGEICVVIKKGEADYASRGDLKPLIEDVKDVIKATSQRLRSLGLSFLLKDLTIEIDLQTGFEGTVKTTAVYDVAKDTITLYAGHKDVLHSLIHELGHRVWYKRFDKETRELWMSFIQASTSDIDPSDVNVISGVFLQAWEETAPNESIYPTMVTLLRKKRTDLAVKFSLLFFMSDEINLLEILKDPYYNKEEIGAAWKYLESVITAFRYLPSKDFSSYANTDPEEAWSESFSLYVRGKRLSKETRHQIETLLRSEGSQPVEGFWQQAVSAIKNFLSSGKKTLAGAQA